MLAFIVFSGPLISSLCEPQACYSHLNLFPSSLLNAPTPFNICKEGGLVSQDAVTKSPLHGTRVLLPHSVQVRHMSPNCEQVSRCGEPDPGLPSGV